MTDEMQPIRTLPAAEVLPVLTYPDVLPAARWLCESFGFTFRWHVGRHRAQVGFGSSAIVLSEPRAEDDPRSGGCSAVLVQIADVDAHCAHSREAGARILEEPTDFPTDSASTSPRTWQVTAGPSHRPSTTSHPPSGARRQPCKALPHLH